MNMAVRLPGMPRYHEAYSEECIFDSHIFFCTCRTQVVKLLQKFHKNHYIEDVRGDKFDSEEFEENNRLFRYNEQLH